MQSGRKVRAGTSRGLAKADIHGTALSSIHNAKGGGQFESNANTWPGLTRDLPAHRASGTTNGQLTGGAFTYLFGPRVNFRHGRITPFAQTLSSFSSRLLEACEALVA